MAETDAQWIHEESFGEYRSLLIEDGQIIAANLQWVSKICAGTIVMAKVVSRDKGRSHGLCVTTLPKQAYEVDARDLPTEATEGSEVRLIIHREPMAEQGRLKRAKGRYFSENPATDAIPTGSLLGKGQEVRNLPKGAWEEVWSLAGDGELAFSGGSLVITPTPAMTLIDIDGSGSPRELALAAVPAIAKAIRWLDLGGSIGIDFPTIEAKTGRKAIDEALAEALADWPHECTAMNGFGFVQIVSRLERPSLLHRLTFSRAESCARYLLRQASNVAEPGGLLLKCHPAVAKHLRGEWIVELAERTGRNPDAIRIETDPKLALEGGFAQAMPL